MKVNMDNYRVSSPYEGIYKYCAPEGYHWMCHNDDFGKVIWGGYDLGNYPYRLVKYERNEEMDNTNNINTDNSNADDGRTH